MNKIKLIEGVARRANLSKAESAKAIDAVFDVLSKAIAAGEPVRLFGFGTFEVSHRAAREGRNPRTGARIKIPASRTPRFRAAKPLKEAMAGLPGDPMTPPDEEEADAMFGDPMTGPDDD